MQGKSVAVCIVVAVLGLISTVVGLVFEFGPDKTLVHLFHFSWNYDDDYCTGAECLQCEYFRSAAFYLVVAAVVSLILAQVAISVSTDCGCCIGRNSSSSSQMLAVLTFIFSWLSCVAAILVYIIGGAKQYGVQFPEFDHFFSSLGSIWADNTQCYKVKPGIFGAAAAFSFGAVALGIITYLALVFGGNRRRFQGVRGNTTTELHNHGNGSDPVDLPVAIALPDIPTTPVPRSATVEPYQIPKEQRRIPVMVEA